MANSIDKAADEADWISLMDYATRYGVSLSTLRRHIKSGKIPFKVEGGRYLLRSPFASGLAARSGASPTIRPAPVASPPSAQSPSAPQALQNEDLKIRLHRAQEEIAELKMLIALYEEQLQPERPGQLRMNGH